MHATQLHAIIAKSGTTFDYMMQRAGRKTPLFMNPPFYHQTTLSFPNVTTGPNRIKSDDLILPTTWDTVLASLIETTLTTQPRC